MVRSNGAGIRTAILAVVGAAAIGAGAAAGGAVHEVNVLMAAGGFALGIAASLALGEARAEGRAEALVEASAGRAVTAGTAERRVAEPPAGAVVTIGPVGGREAVRPDGGALAARSASIAAVAHDMANPLASLRSNLEWLRDALEDGRIVKEQAEAREVLRDAREAAERLRVDVGALRKC